MQETDREKLKKNVVDKYILTASAPVHVWHHSCDAKINSTYLKYHFLFFQFQYLRWVLGETTQRELCAESHQ